MEKVAIELSFCIWEFNDITHNEITSILEINPSKIHIKGERLNPKFPRLAKENGWFLDSPADKFASFEVKMNSLLDIIESNREKFKIICDKYLCEFSCAAYMLPGESTPWIHLGARYIELIKDLKIEFDLDLYQ